MTATEHPGVVESLVLLACGGLVPPEPRYAAALRKVFDVEAPREQHLEAVREAFFAPGNDPAVWDRGWYGVVAHFQGLATTDQPVEYWWRGGDADVLVVQPADDTMAVPENAIRLCAELGERARLITIANAGHALLPEQPEAVADAVIGWLESRPRS